MASGFLRDTYPDGHVLFKKGDVSDCFYMIESGLVDMVVRLSNGEEAILATLGKGESFGELGLIDGQPRMVTARVSLEATVVRIPAEAFQAQFRAVNGVMSQVMRQMARQTRKLIQELILARGG